MYRLLVGALPMPPPTPPATHQALTLRSLLHRGQAALVVCPVLAAASAESVASVPLVVAVVVAALTM